MNVNDAKQVQRKKVGRKLYQQMDRNKSDFQKFKSESLKKNYCNCKCARKLNGNKTEISL
jgi:hypothetical protein